VAAPAHEGGSETLEELPKATQPESGGVACGLKFWTKVLRLHRQRIKGREGTEQPPAVSRSAEVLPCPVTFGSEAPRK
jgi:hypothetical protein